MKINFFILKSLFALCLLMVSCQNSKRDLYPEELIRGFYLLKPIKTGICFNNIIIQTETLNHIYYNQMCSGALVAIADINKDAFLDSLLIGNYYGVEIEITRYDAGNEPILLGNGRNNFTPVNIITNGINLSKDFMLINNLKIKVEYVQ